MNHLKKDQSYQTVKAAIKQDNPAVACSMARMSDCVSAAIEIVSNQLGDDVVDNPQIVLPIAFELFQDSKRDENLEEVEVDPTLDPSVLSTMGKL